MLSLVIAGVVGLLGFTLATGGASTNADDPVLGTWNFAPGTFDVTQIGGTRFQAKVAAAFQPSNLSCPYPAGFVFSEATFKSEDPKTRVRTYTGTATRYESVNGTCTQQPASAATWTWAPGTAGLDFFDLRGTIGKPGLEFQGGWEATRPHQPLTTVPSTTQTTSTTTKPTKVFRFLWIVNGTIDDDGEMGSTVSLRGRGTFTIDGAGKMKKVTGTLSFKQRYHSLLYQHRSDTWTVTLTGGRYHEDPVPTAEFTVTADSLLTKQCDGRPKGTLELEDSGKKKADLARLRACGRLYAFFKRAVKGDESSTATVLLAEVE